MSTVQKKLLILKNNKILFHKLEMIKNGSILYFVSAPWHYLNIPKKKPKNFPEHKL